MSLVGDETVQWRLGINDCKAFTCNEPSPKQRFNKVDDMMDWIGLDWIS